MKILLVNPPANAPNPVLPLGLAYIGATLENASMKVDVIDAWVNKYSFDELGVMIAKGDYDIIGISIISPIYASGMRAVDVAKKNSNAVIVVGGAHASAVPEECLMENGNIDFVVIGEGEKVFTELVIGLSLGKKDWSGVKGLAFRQSGRILNNGHADIIEDLDGLPYPARHLFPIKKYKTHPPYGKNYNYMTIVTSRGCPFKCSYCSKSVFGNKYRVMSSKRVVEEIKHLKEKYGAKEIHFYDDDFTMDMKRANEICDFIIEQNIKIAWSCTTRVDLVNEELLKKMKKAGCWLISYGIESADNTILRNINKGYTIEKVMQVFALTKRVGIGTVGFFMLGLPGETRKTIDKTIAFSLKLNPDFVSWGITALFPGSAMYDEFRKNNSDYFALKYRTDINDVHSSASPFGDGFSVIYEEAFTYREFEEYARRANFLFYFRFRYIVSFLFKIKTFYQFFHYLKGGINILLWTMKSGKKDTSGCVKMFFKKSFCSII